MTQEEKAKAYDEALERAKKIHSEIINNEIIGFPGQIEDIFPELRESEDERIRKALIDGVRQIRCKNGITQEQMISYLEKQKEPENTSASTMISSCWEVEQKEQKPADLPPGFYFIDLDGKKYYSKEFRFGDMKMKIVEDKSGKPAEWSEEDEKMIELIRAIVFGTGKVSNGVRTEIWDWLKSLRPSWKPSEEQMEALEYVIRDYREDSCNATANYLQEILDHLKNL